MQINEGNFYNVEDEIAGKTNASSSGLSRWQMEVRRMLIKQLQRQKIPNIEKIIHKTFGKTLEN